MRDAETDAMEVVAKAATPLGVEYHVEEARGHAKRAEEFCEGVEIRMNNANTSARAAKDAWRRVEAELNPVPQKETHSAPVPGKDIRPKQQQPRAPRSKQPVAPSFPSVDTSKTFTGPVDAPVRESVEGGAPTATESNREGSATPIADNRAVSPSADGASTDAQQPTAVETPTAAAAGGRQGPSESTASTGAAKDEAKENAPGKLDSNDAASMPSPDGLDASQQDSHKTADHDGSSRSMWMRAPPLLMVLAALACVIVC
ncbi:hypothetical protein DQ04_16441000 [Trypanosoma grayi]|uniref:hypothetical protein n=1 Tax=Trypanosoma grayi TaxID=71804 RepID=UPI0004F49894|nr:hypothetical protein DQ04_16441000 [Trypanosoma grayi]KEG06028.1 hypothetical protein DQ04_16441000 [Trypanosoma grayi]